MFSSVFLLYKNIQEHTRTSLKLVELLVVEIARYDSPDLSGW